MFPKKTVLDCIFYNYEAILLEGSFDTKLG